ncbi:hypothetical protein JW921_04660 [Candidatus Fermentibacterales bacterium]|nr:hypothetical protein [Candidatus Fermentibacterales bacterium]
MPDLLPRNEDEGPEDFGPLIGKIAAKIVERQLTVPALIFLESMKPLSFLGNQLLIFMNPLVSLVVSSRDYYAFVRMIEDRENVERLLVAIEEESSRDGTRRAESREIRRSARGRRARRLRGILPSFLRRGFPENEAGDGKDPSPPGT